MVLAISTEIEFYPQKGKSFYLTKVSEIEIESSWQTLVDKAIITLPRNVKDFDTHNIKNIFKTGDKVVIKIGYNGELIKEFEGYITKVTADYPIKIFVSDMMYNLLNKKVNYSSPNAKLRDILNFVGIKEVDIDDINLGAVRFANTTFGAVLDKLQKEWGIHSFIRNNKVVIAKAYSGVNQKKIYKIDLERNCTSSSLEYVSEQDKKVMVKGKASLSNGTLLKSEFGDENPTKNISMVFNVTNQKDLDNEVKRLYNMNKKGGFEGSFTTFGIPTFKHGEKVNITSSLYNDRSGTYYIDSIKKTISESGYRQEVTIGSV